MAQRAERVAPPPPLVPQTPFGRGLHSTRKKSAAIPLESLIDYFKELASHFSDKWFIFFLIQPDSIDAFTAAREIAVKQGFDVGRAPLGPSEPVRIVLGGGGGRRPTVL